MFTLNGCFWRRSIPFLTLNPKRMLLHQVIKLMGFEPTPLQSLPVVFDHPIIECLSLPLEFGIPILWIIDVITIVQSNPCVIIYKLKQSREVLYNTWGRDAMKEWILARLAASTTSSIETSLSLSPYWMFSERVLSNKTGS